MSHYLAFAAGTGISPLFPLIATTLESEPASHVTLVYGNRASSSVLLRDELLGLKDRYLDRLALIFVMSREKQDIDLLNGRIDRLKVEKLFERWIDIDSVDKALISGPPEMEREVATALAGAGFESARIQAGAFDAGLGRRLDPVRPLDPARDGVTTLVDEVTHVSLIFEGKRRDFDMPRSGEPILDAALRHGIDVPYSCRSGVCGSCRAALTSGQVELDVNYALEDYEIARGAILMCQSYPTTANVVVDIDRSI
jgi:ring-1,2-phenylacetyl-CoA epoxidase subunit PaaE